MKNVCAFTRIQRKKKKKKEGYTPDSRMAAIVLGLQKKAGKRDRERKRSSKQVIDRRVFMYMRMNTLLLFSLVTIRLIAITN